MLEPEFYLLWCISLCLFGLSGLMLLVALLHYGNRREDNPRLKEVIWQAQNRDTDWWLEINKKK